MFGTPRGAKAAGLALDLCAFILQRAARDIGLLHHICTWCARPADATRPDSPNCTRTFLLPLIEIQVKRIAKVAYDVAMKRGKRLCSVDKANVLDVSQVCFLLPPLLLLLAAAIIACAFFFSLVHNS